MMTADTHRKLRAEPYDRDLQTALGRSLGRRLEPTLREPLDGRMQDLLARLDAGARTLQ